MAPIPTPVFSYASTVMDNKIYIIGGMTQYFFGGANTFVNLVQIFDPSTDQWTQGTPMPRAMAGMAAAITTGVLAPQRMYVVGGYPVSFSSRAPGNYAVLDWNQIYDPQTRIWTNGTSLPTPCTGLSLVNLDDKLYALGGNDDDGNYFTTNEEYTPADYGLINSPSPSPSPTLSPTTQPTAILTLTPSPSIPEFPAWIVLPTAAAATLTIAICIKKKGKSVRLG